MPEASTAPAITVVLVDDHKTMLWGLEKLLDGATPAMRVVGSASDVAAGQALLDTLRPDIVLLDVDLGGVCSVDFLPALLANGTTRAVMLSGSRDHEVLSRAVRSGARGVVGKDAPADKVIETIARVRRGELCLDPALTDVMLGLLMRPAPAAAPPDPQQARIASLTARERKIIALIVDGNGALNKAIAQRAFISEQTLRNHLSAIYQKLDVANRLELYVYATRHGLASPAE